ncbi:MAG: hypothetical protein NW206_15515 [Hyphomonadaceae bacterium]|nr:hypothetical protein [Hyphomonadaceae bacterium]
MAAVSADLVAKAASRRIVFAHQSVGANILDGVRALANEQGAQMNIVETRDPAPAPGLYHFMVGANEDPRGKIADFRAALSAMSNPPEAAVLKLCYVDFKADTDGAALAREYAAALAELGVAMPQTRFIAATSPLTTLPTGPKEILKSLIGRRSPAPAENAARLAFNQVLRARYQPANLLDIAKLEAGALGEGGVEYLRPSLTYDGGHLNAAGQRLVAAEFLTRIAG